MEQTYTIAEQGIYKISIRFNKDGVLNSAEITVKADTPEMLESRKLECEEIIARSVN